MEDGTVVQPSMGEDAVLFSKTKRRGGERKKDKENKKNSLSEGDSRRRGDPKSPQLVPCWEGGLLLRTAKK